MSWFQKLLPPKIKRKAEGNKKNVPEGLWHKCASCEAVLYHADLEKNLEVCPKCSHHNRISARTRLDLFLDPEGRSGSVGIAAFLTGAHGLADVGCWSLPLDLERCLS